MGVAHGGADILVAEELLDFPEILSYMIKEDRGCGNAAARERSLPQPDRSASGPQP